MTMITAHSGCEGTEIDSLASIDKALEFGADAIEVDVRADPSGNLRISHNAVTPEDGSMKPEFREVLERIRSTNLAINCDIKEQRVLYQTLKEAEKYGIGRDRLILSGCTGPEQLVRDTGIMDRAKIFLNIEEVLKFVYLRKETNFDLSRFGELMNDPWRFIHEKGEDVQSEYADDTVNLYKQLSPDAANLPKNMLGTPLIDKLQDAGIPLSVWTVKEAEIVRQCLDLKVLNITTRDVRQAVSIRKIHHRSS